MGLSKVLPCLVLVLGAALPACHVQKNYQCDGTPPSQQATPPSPCQEFCKRLSQCGSLEEGDIASCESRCAAQHAEDPEGCESGMSCVVRDACRRPTDYQCPGAPMPGEGSTGAHGGNHHPGSGGAGGAPATPGTGGAPPTPGTGGSSSQGGGNPGPTCSDNHDCGANEDCIDCSCRARCEVNCDCPSGQICDEGYCAVPPAP